MSNWAGEFLPLPPTVTVAKREPVKQLQAEIARQAHKIGSHR